MKWVNIYKCKTHMYLNVVFYKVRLADSQAATVRQLQEGKVQSEII